MNGPSRTFAAADGRLAASLGGPGVAGAIEALREYSKSLHLPEHFAVHRKRRRRNQRVLALVGLFLLVVLLITVIDWLCPG